MKRLPVTSDVPVLRTDFSDQAAWEEICEEIQLPSSEGFEAHVEFIDDRAFAGMSKQELLSSIPDGYPHTFLLIVDRTATMTADHPLLVVNLYEESGEEFRAVPSSIQGIENNLSIANMDFEEFAAAVDSSGVFRGF